MKHKSIVLFTIFGMMFGAARSVCSSGFIISQQSARGTAMAAAQTAAVDGPEAVFYNPAALTRLKRSTLKIGLSVAAPSYTLENQGREEDGDTGNFFIPYIYGSLNPGVENLALGVGVYAPFGLGTDWDENGLARYSSYHGKLSTAFISPAVAYRLSSRLSVGAHFSYILGEAELRRKIPFQFSSFQEGLIQSADLRAVNPLIPDGDVFFEGDGTAYGWGVGILYQATENFSLGFSYKGQVDLDLDGAAVYSNLGAAHLPGGVTTFDVDGSAVLPLPGTAFFGAAYRITPSFLLSFDVHYLLWSAFDEIIIDFEDNPYGELGADQVLLQDWDDSLTFMAGAEYILNKEWLLRGGIVYSQDPAPDETLGPLLPESDRLGVSFGVGYRWEKLSLDVGYLGVLISDRSVHNDLLEGGNDLSAIGPQNPFFGADNYNGSTHLVTADLSYKF